MAAKELYSTYLASDANLQAYWRLESSGVDSGPNGYTLTGTAPTYTTGLFGNGGDFELSSSQYISIANASCPNLEISGSQTWSAWVKPEGVTGLVTIMSKSTATDGTTQHRLSINGTGILFTLEGLTTTPSITSDTPAAAGQWFHVVGVYDSADTKIKIFVNGVKKEATASGSAGDSNAPFSIGSEFSGASDTANRFFDGIIDDVAIFNRALTDSEVTTLYEGTTFPGYIGGGYF